MTDELNGKADGIRAKIEVLDERLRLARAGTRFEETRASLNRDLAANASAYSIELVEGLARLKDLAAKELHKGNDA